MPFGELKPVCYRCKVQESSIWRKVANDDQSGEEEIICNECSIELKKTRVYLNPNDKVNLAKLDVDKDQEKETTSECGSSTRNKSDKDDQSAKMLTRKSTRNKRGSNRLNLNKNNLSNNKGKGRRHVFKQNVYKSPASICSPMTRESVYHNGINYQVGDIVSMVDAEDGTTYFAQIKGFLQDQFCEKSCAITWLVPNVNKTFKPIGEFNPADYVLGPEEEYPRKLDCMEFVCRSPSDYYKSGNSPYTYARYQVKPDHGWIWTTIGPVVFNRQHNAVD